jgi:hypothetical protein
MDRMHSAIAFEIAEKINKVNACTMLESHANETSYRQDLEEIVP